MGVCMCVQEKEFLHTRALFVVTIFLRSSCFSRARDCKHDSSGSTCERAGCATGSVAVRRQPQHLSSQGVSEWGSGGRGLPAALRTCQRRTPTSLRPRCSQRSCLPPDRMPVSTHEEWLLRMCGQMMEREAHFVSVMEGKVRGSRLPCPPTKTSCTALGASTGTHMETEETSSLGS